MAAPTSSSEAVFSIQELSIRYGPHIAVSSLSLALSRGKSLGLLGANGAGKTSTIRSLLGMIRPSHGQVSVFGEKPGTLKSFSRIGYAPEDGVPAEFLSGREYLRFVASLRLSDRSVRRNQVEELLEWFELAPTKRIKDYSKGMKRRLVLAQAFLGNPELLILDEPLNGLDPLIIIKLRERVENYLAAGGSLIFSSHILTEVEKTCSHVAILSKGLLVGLGTVNDFVREFGSIEAAFAAKVSQVSA